MIKYVNLHVYIYTFFTDVNLMVKNNHTAIIQLKELHANWKSLHWVCVPRLLIISEANK